MRQKREFDDDLLREAAKRFYEKNLNKTKIAGWVRKKTKTACDGHTVAKMLKLAKKRGLVRIEFPDVEPKEISLARQLKTAFNHLRHVIVLPNRENEAYESLLKRWAEAAATYFEELLKSIPKHQWPLHVGISGGDTLFAVVNAMREELRPDIHIHTTAFVGWGEFEEKGKLRQDENDENLPYHINPITNATILWQKFGRKAGRLHYATVAPLGASRLDSPHAELNRLSEIPPIRNVVDATRNIRIAFAGLGIFDPPTFPGLNKSQLTVANLLPESLRADLEKASGKKVIGDLSYTLFDENGESHAEWEFFLTARNKAGRAGLGFYQDMAKPKEPQDYVIVVAGMRKHRALLPALRAKMFNVWITDVATANAMLDAERMLRGRAGKVRGGG